MQFGLPVPIAGEQIFSLTLSNETRVVAKPDAPGFQSRLKTQAISGFPTLTPDD